MAGDATAVLISPDGTYLVELWSGPDTVVMFEADLIEVIDDLYIFSNGVVINGTEFEAAAV